MHHVEISSLEISETIVGRVVFTTRITRLDPYAKIVRKIDILEKLCYDRASVTILARTPWTLTLGRAATDIKLEAGNVWEVIANGRMAGEFTEIRWNFMLSYYMWARCV
jgi:Mg2+/citrate symporter